MLTSADLFIYVLEQTGEIKPLGPFINDPKGVKSLCKVRQVVLKETRILAQILQ